MNRSLVCLAVLACFSACTREIYLAPGEVRRAPPVALSAGQPNVPSLRIDAVGTATATADQAVISLSLQAREKSAEAARAKLHQMIRQVLALLEELGVEHGDAQIFAVSLQPTYDSGSRSATSAATGREIVAYVASKQSRITVREIGHITEIVRGLESLPGTEGSVTDISLSLSDTRDLENEARKNAMAQAIARAEALARLSGAKLGSPISIDESLSSPSGRLAKEVVSAAGSRDRVLAWSELTMSTSVSLIFALESP